ncbi:MAG TPA: hypothetical protein VMZ06_03940 [Candidatus Bathyarchaeia archaeon]|nr:hypothetical protein [Candidatus Bathyarchaeia archaeon]
MTQRKQRKRGPVIVALALFAGMGALVIVASHWRPQPWDLPPDSVEQRLDRENNAWFTLAEAGDLFAAEKAPAINSVTDWILKEPQEFVIVGRVWQRADYRPAAMLNKRMITDHAELVAALRAYIRRLEPALDKLCEAAVKPWCLDPADPREAAKAGQENYGYGSHPGAGVMTAALINSAVTMSREGQNDGKPCEYVRAWLRLTQFICPRQDMAYQPAQWSYAAETARRAPEPRQDEMLAWLLEFRREWKPPVNTLIWFLRLTEHAPLSSISDPREIVPFVREKRLLAAHARECIGVAEMTLPEAQEYRNQHPEIRRLRSVEPRNWAWFNSRVLSGIDGLTLMLAIEKYKREHGQYPDRLEALAPDYVPQVPMDAFSGKPFIYKKSADSYALYSNGMGNHPNSLTDVTVFNAWPGYEF